MKIVIATHNQNKLREIREIFTGHEILSAEEAGFSEDIEETGKTFGDALQFYFQAHNGEAILAQLEGRIKVVTGDD